MNKNTFFQTQRDHYIRQREHYMALALAEARLAQLENEVPVGAVLVRGDELIIRDHNRCVQCKDPTAHAELLCIRQGAMQLGGRLTDCTLYVTMEPCAMCTGAALNAKLARLVFGAFDDRAGCCGTVLDLADHCFLSSIEVWGGILEEECACLLKSFFAKRRV